MYASRFSLSPLYPAVSAPRRSRAHEFPRAFRLFFHANQTANPQRTDIRWQAQSQSAILGTRTFFRTEYSMSLQITSVSNWAAAQLWGVAPKTPLTTKACQYCPPTLHEELGGLTGDRLPYGCPTEHELAQVIPKLETPQDYFRKVREHPWLVRTVVSVENLPVQPKYIPERMSRKLLKVAQSRVCRQLNLEPNFVSKVISNSELSSQVKLVDLTCLRVLTPEGRSLFRHIPLNETDTLETLAIKQYDLAVDLLEELICEELGLIAPKTLVFNEGWIDFKQKRLSFEPQPYLVDVGLSNDQTYCFELNDNEGYGGPHTAGGPFLVSAQNNAAQTAMHTLEFNAVMHRLERGRAAPNGMRTHRDTLLHQGVHLLQALVAAQSRFLTPEVLQEVAWLSHPIPASMQSLTPAVEHVFTALTAAEHRTLTC